MIVLKLAGKTALLTDRASEIALATAKALNKEKATIVLLDQNSERFALSVLTD